MAAHVLTIQHFVLDEKFSIFMVSISGWRIGISSFEVCVMIARLLYLRHDGTRMEDL